jgi:hypothetical protein
VQPAQQSLIGTLPAQHNQPQGTATLQDITISCGQCNNDFCFTAKNQKEYSSKEPPWSTPKRCHSCRSTDKECETFATKGICPYGINCRFTHGGEAAAVQGRRLQQLLPGQYNAACKEFVAGSCSRDDACPFQHQGRENQQRAKSAQMQSAKLDQVPETGYSGMRKRN